MEPLTPQQLAAVAGIWTRSGKQLETSFGGTSMLPAIRPGQRVVIDCRHDVSDRGAKVGDVIAFLSGGQVIVHRVAGIRRGWILPRGDANLLPDEPIEGLDAIIGRIVQVEGEDGAFGEVPPAPRGPLRAMVSRVAVSLLAIHPHAARKLLHALITLRRYSTAATMLLRRGRPPR